MIVGHRLTGYSKTTELLEQEIVVPAAWRRNVMEVAGVAKASDPEAIGSYPIAPDRLPQLTNLLSPVPNSDKFDWFLEPLPMLSAVSPAHAACPS